MIIFYKHKLEGGGIDSIMYCYIAPQLYFPDSFITDISWNGHTYHEYTGGSVVHDTFQTSKPTSVNGYTPKNKKLLTFPFCFMVASNNSGNSNVYQYEKWNSSNCKFQISGTPTIGCSIKLTPEDYTENRGYDFDEGIVCGKFPMMNWSKDEYNTWIQQNALNLNGQVATGVLATAFGLSSGDFESGVSGILQITDVMRQVYQHSLTPNSSRGNVNSGDLNFAQGFNTFFFYKKSISYEYAKIIDDYFSMFGYKINTLKVPNITGRTNWNFVKTIKANVDSTNVPEKYINEFKEMLNKGITFWHNPSTFMDYSQTNSIIS